MALLAQVVRLAQALLFGSAGAMNQATEPELLQPNRGNPAFTSSAIISMMEQSMNASKSGGHNVSNRREKPSKSIRDSGSTTRIEFADVDSPFQTILFVDDEPDILEARRLLFENLGFSVLTADCENRALSLLRLAPVDAVVVDSRLGGASGEPIVHKIRQIYGDLLIVLSSRGLAIPQDLLEIADASIDKSAGALALLDALEELMKESE